MSELKAAVWTSFMKSVQYTITYYDDKNNNNLSESTWQIFYRRRNNENNYMKDEFT